MMQIKQANKKTSTCTNKAKNVKSR